jgi:hypothetical protein
MKNKLFKLLLILPLLFAACTDLEETYYSEISPGKVPLDSQVNAIYTLLKGSNTSNPKTCPWWKLVYAVQTSTDELCIPRQEANDWEDGGIYQDMQNHSWTPDNTILLSSWNYLYNIISNCNLLLVKYEGELSNANLAELQTLRAYAYYRLMDLFGSVPLLTAENFGEPQMPAKTSREDLFYWIEKQLMYIGGNEGGENVETFLKDKKYGAMTKGVLNTLKARLYLNSYVYLGLSENADEYIGEGGYLQKAIDACDAVINSNVYALEENVFANWFLSNGSGSKEIIFGIPFAGDGSNEGNELYIETLITPMARALGYKIGVDEQGRDILTGGMYGNATSGWHVNPSSGTTSDNHDGLVDLFDDNDNRRLAILQGQLYDRQAYINAVEKNETPVFKNIKLTMGVWDPNDDKNPVPNSRRQLINANLSPWFYGRGFNPEGSNVPSLNVYKAFGARIIKFELAETPQFYSSPVDMVVMRYAEVLYTKAEALIRQGKNAEAIPLFNQVLQHRGFDPTSDANYDKNYPFLDPATDIYGNETGEYKISAVALMSKKWLTGRTTSLTSIIPASPDLDFMDDEWRREFIFEDRRRTDMIRMGKFAGPDAKSWGCHDKTTSANRNIFPIPQVVINANPAVLQNNWQ